MEHKNPIPIPPAQRWREFRIQLLPIVVFIIVAISAALLWKQVHSPMAIVGEVMGMHSQVRTLVDGTVQELSVGAFSAVSKGQIIGRILPSGSSQAPSVMATEVAAGEVERLRTAMGLNRGYLEITALELQKQKNDSDLEIAKADLPVKKADADRAKEQFQRGQIEKVVYDAAAGSYQKALTTINELNKMVLAYEQQLKSFAGSQKLLDQSVQRGVIDELIKAQTNAVAQLNRPFDLVSPTDGVVSTNSFRAGENVRAGDSVVTVASTNSSFILGYIRQPSAFLPNVDDEVEVRSRFTRNTGSAKVLKVGSEYSEMSPSLVAADNTRPERALRVMVSMPNGLSLRPGELVDIALVRK